MFRQKALIIIFSMGIILLGIKVYFIIATNNINNTNIKINIMDSPKSIINHKKLMIDDFEIHYYISGQKNKDLILFLHPAFSDHRAFGKQIDYFSKKYCVITIDLIGHGLSKANKSKDKIDNSAKHIYSILKAEGFTNAHLVGVSLGSLVAQYFAFKYPKMVKSLTALGGYDIHKENKEVVKAQASVNLGLIVRAIFSMKAFRKKTAELTCHTKSGQDFFYKTASLFERKSFLVMQGLKNIIKNRTIQKPDYPSLIIVGEYDIPLAKSMAKLWQSQLPNSHYYIIENAGHCANIDQAKKFNEVVKNFID